MWLCVVIWNASQTLSVYKLIRQNGLRKQRKFMQSWLNWHNSVASRHLVPHRHISSTSLLWLTTEQLEKIEVGSKLLQQHSHTIWQQSSVFVFHIRNSLVRQSQGATRWSYVQNNCTWNSPPLSSASQAVISRFVNTAKFVKNTNGVERTEQKMFGLFRNYVRFVTRRTILKIIL
jgi:hypothetical protein